MPSSKVTGSCLCGKVSYEISGEPGVFQYCHCSRCRKFTGSAHAANIIISPEQFKWLTGKEHVGRFEHEDARHFATSFCKNCGSSLPWLGKTKKAVVIPAGTLDTNIEAKPSQNIFWGSKAQWYIDASELVKHEKLPTK